MVIAALIVDGAGRECPMRFLRNSELQDTGK